MKVLRDRAGDLLVRRVVLFFAVALVDSLHFRRRWQTRRLRMHTRLRPGAAHQSLLDVLLARQVAGARPLLAPLASAVSQRLGRGQRPDRARLPTPEHGGEQ